jgi:hypothetical protein
MRSLRDRRCGHRQTKGPGSTTRGVPDGWARSRHDARYRQAKATKRGGMADEQSESADSTEECGELTPEDPREGSGRPV